MTGGWPQPRGEQLVPMPEPTAADYGTPRGVAYLIVRTIVFTLVLLVLLRAHSCI